MKNLISFLTLTLLCVFQSNGQLAELVAKNEKAIFQIFSYDEFGAGGEFGAVSAR